MTVVAIVQARMESSRFPGKVLHEVGGRPLIAILLERLQRAASVDAIVVATPATPANRELGARTKAVGHRVYRGSEDDVLDRYYRAAVKVGADTVVRITGDCPLVDPEVVDAVVARFFDSGADYASNTIPPTFPDGLDTEVFTFNALERSWREATDPVHREHVTLYMKESGAFSLENVRHEIDWSAERWTVDQPEDLEVIRRVIEHFAPDTDFSWRCILDLRVRHPDWFTFNDHLARDEGLHMSQGQKLWRRAKAVIPGGNMLLSKRAEMFLPDQWPAYYNRAAGCTVWDLDERPFVDMSLMGIGTNTLGYAHPEVDEAAQRAISLGNMSTLNCPEEVRLAERLVELHPWSDMVRLARTGGEANAIAIRIGRAASGRDKVAFCGYHGWHDWYLSANLGDSANLAGHLLPGLDPLGVPSALRGTAIPFSYNNFDQLKKIVEAGDVGVIKMEVSRNIEPEPGFLKEVRALASRHKIVLVFDECSSGFRQSFGGLHKAYGVEPDLAVFGKTLGNGYAITAVIGTRAVMDSVQDTFISSTFWTERIGPSAALATLAVMKRERSWEVITEIGRRVGHRWSELATRHGLTLTLSGLPAMLSFAIRSERMREYRTLITQEMLKAGYLATNTLYACTQHSDSVVDRYFDALDPIFSTIKECEDGLDVTTLLEGPLCHVGFRRLN